MKEGSLGVLLLAERARWIVLVRRAQSKINQATLEERHERAWREHL